ncbi:MAG: YdcF family protein [Pseudomonadota bacterium]
MGMIFRFIRRAVRLVILVLLITVGAVWAAERYALANFGVDRMAPVEAVIVLGGGVAPDFTLNYVGRARADTAVAVLQIGKGEVAIFTGTLNRVDRPEGEAGLMRNRAIQGGVAANRLFIEPDAQTTLENLRFSFALGEAQGFTKFAILTDAFHLPRALALAHLLGKEDVVAVASPGLDEHGVFVRGAFLVREAMAWWFNLGKAVVWKGMELAGMDENARGAIVQ